MSEIQNININKVKVVLADTDDPIALRVSWNPKKKGGASFKTQRLIKTTDKIIIKASKGAYFFAMVFLVPGVIATALISPYLLAKGKTFPSIFLFFWGALFAAGGVFLLQSVKPFTLDRLKGTYCRGKKPKNLIGQDRKKFGYMQDVHAIQLVKELISSRSDTNRDGHYTSYEMNLVFKDAERINIMDHGDGAEVEKSAKILGDFLGVPIWKAEY